jgi:mycothiol synthase
VVAYALGYEYEADTAATGVRDCYLGQIGTRRDWRGRGAARALIANTLTIAARDGYQRASLGVDAANPTGALGLYERIGFRAVLRTTAYLYDLDS